MPVSQEDQALAARIDAMVAPYFKPSGPGAALLVVKDGKPLLRKAYGLADVARGLAMQPDMAMRVGSITKQFTATAILMLADEGKLALSDPITQYLPGFPERAITVEHLLRHTSGIANFTAKLTWRENAAREIGMAQMIDSFKNDPLEFAPGARYAYNNSGYYLLGAIIEKVSGQPYAKFVEQRIFTPLGMLHTAYEGQERTPVPRAAGHSADGRGGFRPAPVLHMSQPYAAGALVSTVDDLARWDAAVSSGKLLKPATWTQALAEHKLADGGTAYGYGWEVNKVRGLGYTGHGGDIHGYSAYSLRLPQHKLYVALLTNADSGLVRPEVVAKKAAAIAFGDPHPEFKAVAVDAKTLDSYAGAYKYDERMTRTVRRSGDHLTVQRPGRSPQDLYPLGADRFFMKDMLAIYRFERDPAGAVQRLVLDNDGAEFVHPRIGDAGERQAIAVAADKLDTYTGRYQITPAFSVELTRKGDKLFAQATGQQKYHLVPVGDDVFYVKDIDAEVRFEQGNQQVLLVQGGRTTPGKRIQ